MKGKELDFEYLNDRFLSNGANTSVAALHGMLCGRLSGGALPQARWQAAAVDYLEIKHLRPEPETLALLDLLRDNTARQLTDQHFRFQPLVPGDDATLARRVAELSQWCKGYLMGLGASGLAGDSQLAPDIAEALRDIAQIATADTEMEDGEENEVYWFELVEYIKVAVLNIYAELQLRHNIPSGSESGASDSLH